MKNKQSAFPSDLNGKYSETFKQFVVWQILEGKINMEQTRKRYQIGGKSTVSKWVKKYGINQKEDKLKKLSNKKEETDEHVKLLEKALEDANLQLEYYEIMMELAKERYNIDIKKNFGLTQLTDYGKDIQS